MSKHILSFFRSCLIFAAGLAALAITSSAWAQDDGHAVDHEALRTLRDQVEKAINAGDMNELAKYFAKNFSFITSHQTVITKPEELGKYWDSIFKNESSPVIAMSTKISADNLTQFLAPDTGYCQGTSSDIYTLKDKRKIAISSRWSAMLVKEENQWKLRTAHIGVNFLDNPVLAAKDMSWFKALLVRFGLSKLPGEVE